MSFTNRILLGLAAGLMRVGLAFRPVERASSYATGASRTAYCDLVGKDIQ